MDIDPEFVAKLDALRNTDWYRKHAAGFKLDPSLTHTGTHGYGPGNIFPDPQPGPTTTLHFDRLANGEYECRIYDPDRRLCFTLVGTFDTDLDISYDAFDFNGRGVMLPVRAEPQPVTDPVANPNPTSVTFVQPPYTYIGDPPNQSHAQPTPIYAHSHRHPHTKYDDPLAIDYWHEHPHRHPGTLLDPVGGHRHFYDHGGDASIHDHSHG